VKKIKRKKKAKKQSQLSLDGQPKEPNEALLVIRQAVTQEGRLNTQVGLSEPGESLFHWLIIIIK
jgi:hypothetical protein